MTFSTTEILIGVIALSVFILAIAVLYLSVRLNRVLKGKSGKDLEESFQMIEKEYRAMKNFRDAMSAYLKNVDEKLKKTVRTVKTIRFNPWKGNGDGGNQSFASAFLSENGDGVILSSLHSRDRMSIFAKPIEKGKSSYELSAEEKEVLKKAQTEI